MKTNRRFTIQASPERLTALERAARIAVGTALMGTLVFATSPLGWAAVLPLIAVYPILTGVMGQEPLRFFFKRGSAAYRAAQFTIGGALVGSVLAGSYFTAVPTEVLALLPLMGIYYVLAGIMGQAPLASMEDSTQYDALPDGGAPIPATVMVAAPNAAIKPVASRAHAA